MGLRRPSSAWDQCLNAMDLSITSKRGKTVKFIGKLSASAAAVALAAISSLMSIALPAHADVCHTGHDVAQLGGAGWIYGCPFTARVQVQCHEDDYSIYYAYGPYVREGRTSWARCHEFAWPSYAFVDPA